ncbi:phage terminase small subunit [Candidatus Sodalis pierantonius]|uniref:phage terminase small subunit n=1 Tax=Candidatus Sodalis pierantonii TaxID=1486991 RepID=UPI001F009356|nr:phage terminase small subunit [Candidatus Sodalis pierantonius]
MSNPARYHRAFVAAQLAASQDESAQMSHLGHYELLLFKLKQDLDWLHHVESRRRKAQLKREMLPIYQPWVAGVLASGTGAQNAVLMRILVWLLDVGDITAALDIGDYALYTILCKCLFSEVTVQAVTELDNKAAHCHAPVPQRHCPFL